MPDLALTVADRPVAPDQFSYIETHAWWLGSCGPHQHLTEHRVRQWVPAVPDGEWLLERELTGGQRWLTGSEREAIEDGFDPRDVAPVGRFSARYGDFRDEGDDPARCPALPARASQRGSWQAPTVEFFARLPRDPGVLLERLRGENPGSWFSPFTAAVTALRTALVPAELRSAFYRALLCLPGVRLAERLVRNVDDAECVAIVHDGGRTCTELLIDPADGQFAGERDTLRSASRTGLPGGTVISTTAVRTAVVDHAGARPDRWSE